MIECIFHGHSFVEVQHEKTRIFVDPFIEGNTLCDLTLEQAIDKNPSVIVITHGHGDHIGQSVEIAKATGALVVSTFELIEWMLTQGVEHVSRHHIGGRVQYERGSIKFTPAFHGGNIPGTDITTVPAGVLLTLGGHTIHHAGDTALTKEFELLGEYENISVSFLPIGDRFTMGREDAVRAVQMIQPKYVVPVHFDTWKIIEADTESFAREVMQQGIAVPKILKAGQMIVLE